MVDVADAKPFGVDPRGTLYLNGRDIAVGKVFLLEVSKVVESNSSTCCKIVIRRTAPKKGASWLLDSFVV
jgi:hypothetical protein